MKKKLLFLTLALIASLPVLTSCSKDNEETLADKALKDVRGTEWLGYDKSTGATTIYFYSDGTYLWELPEGAFSEGTFTQSGPNIRFTVKREWYMPYDYAEGTIGTHGMSLTIPLYYYDGEYAKDVKFTLNTLKD